MAKTLITLKFDDKKSTEGQIDSYYGSLSLFHFARIVNLSAFAYANGELSNSASSYRNFESFSLAPEKGSFIQSFLLDFASDIPADLFSNFLIYNIKRALGLADENDVHPDLKHRIEPILDLPEKLEDSIAETHKIIDKYPGMTINIEADNVSMIFDRSTLEETRIIKEENIIEVIGQVTRFNTNSHNGRLYSEKDKRTVSFKLIEPSSRDVSLVTDSLHASGQNLLKNIVLHAKTQRRESGKVKKYLVILVSPYDSTNQG
ncbi:MAG: hypothetical protein GJU72_14385 [Acidithiobacillus ferriphilus]|jgi:hypothetical protein|uniref:DUF7947 five-stranded beta-barrel domain-containing protein n=1 Tax=Acidithiobacillus ferriphilus TaxID=1689834 RepID=UPI00242F56CF|nr:hypothetical protein [Acidithiobacillus ferriphilus]MBW9250211.1 hypothetical protein [Acidithiobacillus ferriphilus]MBW9255078.1 hypothetical protein [Acidithiobacillus ferriphilus]